MLSEMERELKQTNLKQMQGMIEKWRQEKSKFYNFLDEDRNIES